ncbi:hypothetical protein [Pseudolactococcus hodotermopsidis]|nr:hypothetical protein [Lactococcus hodotermopsidis]
MVELFSQQPTANRTLEIALFAILFLNVHSIFVSVFHMFLGVSNG